MLRKLRHRLENNEDMIVVRENLTEIHRYRYDLSGARQMLMLRLVWRRMKWGRSRLWTLNAVTSTLLPSTRSQQAQSRHLIFAEDTNDANTLSRPPGKQVSKRLPCFNWLIIRVRGCQVLAVV